MIILGVKTLIVWSLRYEFKEISSWHSSRHSNPNSWWCFYGTLWMLFGPYLDYLNPNLGLPLDHGSINFNHVSYPLDGLLTLVSCDSSPIYVWFYCLIKFHPITSCSWFIHESLPWFPLQALVQSIFKLYSIHVKFDSITNLDSIHT